MSAYTEFQQKQQDTIESFPMFFAFNEKQFNEGLEKLKVKAEDLISIQGGGCIKKADKKAYLELFDNHDKKRKEFFSNDENLIDAINYELGNHEFCITLDPEPTLSALGFDVDNLDERVEKCFVAARRSYLDWCNDNDIF